LVSKPASSAAAARTESLSNPAPLRDASDVYWPLAEPLALRAAAGGRPATVTAVQGHEPAPSQPDRAQTAALSHEHHDQLDRRAVPVKSERQLQTTALGQLLKPGPPDHISAPRSMIRS
jgi:hypothetical protein